MSSTINNKHLVASNNNIVYTSIGNPVHISSGNVISYLGVRHDFSEIKQLEDAELDALKNYTIGMMLHYKITKAMNYDQNENLVKQIDAEMLERHLLK
jgi:hypothetical protein